MSASNLKYECFSDFKNDGTKNNISKTVPSMNLKNPSITEFPTNSVIWFTVYQRA